MGWPDGERERDLARIDAALAEGRATSTDARERQFEELALALRDDAPEPDPAFAHELDRRLADGFARPRRLALPGLRAGFWMPALGAAAAIVAAVVVAVALLSGGGSEGSATPTRSVGEGPTGAQAISAGGAAAGAPLRHVERSAQLTIAAPADRLQRVGDAIGRVAAAHRGYVVSSSIASGAGSARGASFVLRVPSSQLAAVLGELGRLGRVRARSESSHDMTGPYRGTQQQLGDALLARSAARVRLRHVKGTSAAGAARARLDALDARVSGLNGRMHDLRQRTVYSTVTVTLEQQSGAGAGAGPAGGIDGAVHDALATLSGALGLAAGALALLLAVGLLAGPASLAGSGLRRRWSVAARF